MEHQTKLLCVALSVVCWLLLLPVAANAANGIYNVRTDYGAVGDGSTNDTTAFQNAMNQAASDGGGIVIVPDGLYYIATHLTIPSNVTLEGIWRTPARCAAWNSGSTLEAVENAGSPNGTPFITMDAGSAICGMQIHYPNQTISNPPVSYPWTIRGNGANVAIKNLLITNPFKGVDFGTNACDNHSVDGLYAQPLNRGIYIDKCDRGGTLENVHFWPFWDLDTNDVLTLYIKQNCIGFQFGETLGEKAIDLFSIFHWKVAQWDDYGNGLGSGCFTNFYPDISLYGYEIDGVDAEKGITINNALTMGRAEVTSNNTGPVRFVCCGWISCNDTTNGNTKTSYHIQTAGTGCVSLTGGILDMWDRTATSTAAIKANSQSIIFTGTEFAHSTSSKYKYDLGANVRNAVIIGNRFVLGDTFRNNTTTGADIQKIYNNAS